LGCMTFAKYYILIVMIIISGCTICERPYIKDNGSCCMDNNSNSICDDNEELIEQEVVELQPNEEIVVGEEVVEEKSEQSEEILLHYSLRDVNIISRHYEAEDQDNFFYVSTIAHKLLDGGKLQFEPNCGADHTVNIFINNKLLEETQVKCSENNTFLIDKGLIEEGKNQIEFFSKEGPYMIRDITVWIYFDGMETSEQYLENFVIEPKRVNEEIASLNSVSLKNYFEIEFDLSSKEATGLQSLTFDAKDEGFIIIYLNDERIFEGDVEKGQFKLNLPEKNVNIGENEIRYIIMP